MSHAPGQPDASQAAVARVQELFIKHSGQIKGYLLAVSSDLSEVDDLLHRTFLAITAKAEDFRPGTNFLAWARAVAKIEVLRANREAQHRARALSPAVIDSLTTDAVDIDASPSRLVKLVECMKELSRRAREIVNLRYREAKKPGEIARQLNLAPETIYVALSRARSVLRECVERKMHEEEGP